MENGVVKAPAPRRRVDYERGPAWMRSAFLYWRTALAFFDLQGSDKRPSRTTLAAASVVLVGEYVAVRTLEITMWLVIWTFGGLLLLWSRWKFARFADRVTSTRESERTAVTVMPGGGGTERAHETVTEVEVKQGE